MSICLHRMETLKFRDVCHILLANETVATKSPRLHWILYAIVSIFEDLSKDSVARMLKRKAFHYT